MFDDFKELLAALNAHKVKYLVVGAYAVGYHAQPRATKDLDILIQPAPKNGEALYRALAAFRAPGIESLSPGDFIEKGTFYRMGVPPIAVDVLPEIAGVSFGKAWKNRLTVVVDAETGLTAHFISKSDLIAAKLASGRLQDLADVEALREADASAAQEVPHRRIMKKQKSDDDTK
jgi:hypothetical protein